MSMALWMISVEEDEDEKGSWQRDGYVVSFHQVSILMSPRESKRRLRAATENGKGNGGGVEGD